LAKTVLKVLVVLLLFTAIFAVGFVSGVAFHLKEKQSSQEVIKPAQSKYSLDLVREVIDNILHGYVEEVDPDKLVEGAVKGAVESLDDPYTHYLDSTHFKTFQENTSGFFYGVGIQIDIKGKYPVVVAPIENTPAWKAGIKEGDLIIKVDGKSMEGVPIDAVVAMIRGEEGTKVVLTIRREGEKNPIDFEVKRARIDLPNIASKMLNGDIGYVRIHSFGEGTAKSLREAVEKLTEKGAKGLVIDVRNNPGGLLNEAVLTASLFIERGVIVKVESRSGKEEVYNAIRGVHGVGKVYDLPLVILVNKGSASASEILAGAIQDHKRGILVGEGTFGKGSVQNMVPLSNNAGLVITTAKYLTPNGRDIHKKGIEPDVKVQAGEDLTKEDPQLDKAQEILTRLLKKAA
jgi:carboxyl-terminal processing protease